MPDTQKSYEELNSDQKSAIDLLGISKRMFAQLGSSGVLRKIARPWASLNKSDQDAAKIIGYNAPQRIFTRWSQQTIEYNEDNSGDVVDISPGYSTITWHKSLWKNTPEHIKKAALQLHFDEKLWDQIASLIAQKEKDIREEQSRKGKADNEAKKTAEKLRKAEALNEIRSRHHGSSESDSPAPKLDAEHYTLSWNQMDTDTMQIISALDKVEGSFMYTKAFGVYAKEDIVNAEEV